MGGMKITKDKVSNYWKLNGPAWEAYVFLVVFIVACVIGFFPGKFKHALQFCIFVADSYRDAILAGGTLMGLFGMLFFWIFFPHRFTQVSRGNVLYHYTPSLEAILKTRRVLGRADGRVYVVSDPQNTNLGVFDSKKAMQVVVFSAPATFKYFKPISGGRYTYDGWKQRRGEWRAERAADLRIRKYQNAIVGPISGVEVLRFTLLPHTGFLAALSSCRLGGRRIFLSSRIWLLFAIATTWSSFNQHSKPRLWAPWVQDIPVNWHFVWFIDLFVAPIVVFIVLCILWFSLQTRVDKLFRFLERKRRNAARRRRAMNK